MPQMYLIPLNQPMTPEEIAGRVQQGWIILGQQLLATGQRIATPDQPGGPPGATPVNVWFLPEPMMPVSQLIEAMASAFATFGESSASMASADLMAQMLFGTSVEQTLRTIEESQSEEPQDPSDDQPRGVVPPEDQQ